MGFLSSFLKKDNQEIETSNDIEQSLQEMDEADKENSKDYLHIIKEMNVQDDKYGNTLLISSVIQGAKDVVNDLLSWGADVNIRNKSNQTALEIALVLEYENNNSRREIVSSIVNSCLENKVSDYFDAEDSLLKACENNDTKTVKKLINAGMFLNFQDQGEEYLETALMKAVKKNNIRVVEMLVEAGANLNLQQDLGYTALIIAIIEGHTEIACLLIKAGADYNIASKYGNMSALTWAVNNKINKNIGKIISAFKEVGALKNFSFNE